jgi:hypothetical protein
MATKKALVVITVMIVAVAFAMGIYNFIRMRSEKASNPYLTDLRATNAFTNTSSAVTNSGSQP